MLNYMASCYVPQRSILGIITYRMRIMKPRRFRRACFDCHSATLDDHPARNHRCTALAPKVHRMMRRDGDVHVFGPVVVVESNVKMMLAHSILAYLPYTSRGRDEFNVYSSDPWRSEISG
jgi:hypothetical protein